MFPSTSQSPLIKPSPRLFVYTLRQNVQKSALDISTINKLSVSFALFWTVTRQNKKKSNKGHEKPDPESFNKVVLFGHQRNNKKADELCMRFFSILVFSRCLNPLFQNQYPLFCCLLLFNPQIKPSDSWHR